MASLVAVATQDNTNSPEDPSSELYFFFFLDLYVDSNPNRLIEVRYKVYYTTKQSFVFIIYIEKYKEHA